tara:strand:- start:4920 stop:6461 length:1542 start_codon:yes stop_codon:yes gene_type:complete
MKIKKLLLAAIVIVTGTFLAIGIILPRLNQLNGQTTESHDAHDDKKQNHVEHEQGTPGEHKEHGEHDEDKEHGKEAIRLSNAEMKEFNIELDKAGPGKLNKYINLPGEILIDPDRLAHIVPRVPGIVREVRKTLGDRVQKKEIMAILESAELGQAKIEYLALKQQLKLAQMDFSRIQMIHDNTTLMLNILKNSPNPEALHKETEGLDMGKNRSRLISAYTTLILTRETYSREKNLYKKKISSQADFLEAERDYKSAQANYSATYDEISFSIKRQLFDKSRTAKFAESAMQAAERRLYILGLTNRDLLNLQDFEKHDIQLARVEIRAPFNGTVIEKHITLGEVLKEDSKAFVIADLSSLWVDLNVYQKDLPFVRKGQQVIISAGHNIPDASGTVSLVMPLVGEETRTALARVVLPNSDKRWFPGLFVNGKIALENQDVPLLIPKSAIQTIEGRLSVFIKTDEGFEPQPITAGRESGEYVEIISGLKAGQLYVRKGVFTLKAQLAKGSFGDGHNH